MPRYEYLCPECGIVEQHRAMGAAGSVETCADCGSRARRVFSAPLISRASRELTAALEKAEASGHQPAVVQRENDRSPADPSPPPNPAMERLVGRDAAQRLETVPHPAKRGR